MPETAKQDRIETVTVDSSPMEVFIFEPANISLAHAGIILAQHIPVGHTGIENDTFTLNTARRLADNGYVVAVPFIFHWWPKDSDIQVKREQSRDDYMVADMQASFDLLSQLEVVDERRIAVIGHCWGGRVAWLAACHIPQLAAFAMFYGGRVKVPMGESNPAPITLAAQIRCPVIGFFGNDDTNPSPADVDDYARALTDTGVRHEFHRYDNAGHAFQNFPTPDRYREHQSEDAWRKLLAFLNSNLSEDAEVT